MMLGPKTRALIEVLTGLRDLLRQHGIEHWAEWIEIDRDRLQRGDFSGIDHLLSAFGGMGSINDVVLRSATTPVSLGKKELANEVLQGLLSRAFDLANQISREAAAVD